MRLSAIPLDQHFPKDSFHECDLKWVGLMLPRVRHLTTEIARLYRLPKPRLAADIGSAPRGNETYRIHDIAASMVLNAQDSAEMFGAGICRARRTHEIGEAIATDMGARMTTWLPSFMTGMFDPISKVFVDGLLKPLLRGIINGVADAFVDIFVVLLVVIIAVIIDADCASLGDTIEADILFFCPPAMTIMLSGSLMLRLSMALTTLIAKHFNSYMTAAATPALSRSTAHSLSQNLQNVLQTSVLHQLQEPLVHTLSYGLKDAVPHYYYCTHCYYYGDYCQYCFYQRDYNWLDSAWWQGRLHPRNARERQFEESENDGGDAGAGAVVLKDGLKGAFKRHEVPLTTDMKNALLRVGAAKKKVTPEQESEGPTERE